MVSVDKGKQPCVGTGGDDGASALLRSKQLVSKELSQESAAYGGHLRLGFERIWNSMDFADIRLLVGNEEIASHRVVLALQSPVLHAKLARWTPAGDGVPSIRIELPDPAVDSVADFKEVLRFMYCGACCITSHTVLGLLHISNYYEVLPLKEACGEFLFDLLSQTDVVVLLELSEKYAMRSLRKLLSVHMATNFEGLLHDNALWDLSVVVWEEILCREVLAVPDEAAVLNAVKEYVRRLPKPQQQPALVQLLPCVRMPLLGVKTLVTEIESDPFMMSIPGAKDLLYHAFRHLLLTAQPSSASAPSADLLEAARSAVSDAPPQAGLGAVAALAAGPSTSYAAQAPDSTRLQELMQLQGRPRKQLLSFDQRLSLGFELSAGRTVATVLPNGGLLEGPNPFEFGDDFNQPDRVGEMRRRVRRLMAGQMAGGRQAAGPGPPGGPGAAAPGQQGPPRPDARTSFVTVSPGVAEGCQFVELRIGPSFTTPQNLADMCIWVVKAPVLEAPGLGRGLRLSFEQQACAYASVSGGANLSQGVISLVLPPHMRGRHGMRQLGIQNPQDRPPQMVEGYGPGDVIGISIRITPGRTASQLQPDYPRATPCETAHITFYRNHKHVHGVTLHCNFLPRTNAGGARQGADAGAGPGRGGQAAQGGAGGGGSGGGSAGAWQVMVSSKHVGDTVAVVRPAAAKILSKERVERARSSACSAATEGRNKRKRSDRGEGIPAGGMISYLPRLDLERLGFPIPMVYHGGMIPEEAYIPAGFPIDDYGDFFNEVGYDSFDGEDEEMGEDDDGEIEDF